MMRRRSASQSPSKNSRKRFKAEPREHENGLGNESTGNVTMPDPDESKANVSMIEEACIAVAQEFICVCCMDIMVQATVLVPCGHSFCNSCVFHDPPLSRLEKCPSCRQEIQYTIPNRSVNNAIQAMANSSMRSSAVNNSATRLVMPGAQAATVFFSTEDILSYHERLAAAPPERNLLPNRTIFTVRSRSNGRIPPSAADSPSGVGEPLPDPEGRARELQQEVRWLLADQQRTVQELRQQLRRRVDELRQQVQEVNQLHDRVRLNHPPATTVALNTMEGTVLVQQELQPTNGESSNDGSLLPRSRPNRSYRTRSRVVEEARAVAQVRRSSRLSERLSTTIPDIVLVGRRRVYRATQPSSSAQLARTDTETRRRRTQIGTNPIER